MTEYEITLTINEYANKQWSVLQFWASVSFGLMAISHISTKKINLLAIITITALYLAFSLFVLNILKMDGAIIDGFIKDLQTIATNNGLANSGTNALISAKPSKGDYLIIIFTYFGTFLASVIFLWSSHLSKLKTRPIT